MRSLPSPGGPKGADPSFDSGLPAAADEVLASGEQALRDTRKRGVDAWVMAGAAFKTLQLYAMHRSNSNRPAGRRYAGVYAALEYPYPELRETDRTTRSDAIWLFENEDTVKEWLATVPRNQRDRWTHPNTVREKYSSRHLPPAPPRTHRQKARPSRTARSWNRQKLGAATSEDLETMLIEARDLLEDRERENAELEYLLAEKERESAQLREDNDWLRAEKRQAEKIANPGVVAEDARIDREIVPPTRFGQLEYGRWARLMVRAIAAAMTVAEIEALQTDNAHHFAAAELAVRGAGVALEERIAARLRDLARQSP
jgi:hypothetical protein